MIMIGDDHPYLTGDGGSAVLIMVDFFKIIMSSRGVPSLPHFPTSVLLINRE